ncbi:MAG: formylglycine-generating enzyme family protein, partial [Candidatus Omnitrophica bacterium]|nr:formylglycine-generating enzyme family protein [Candidatus Omnitrophota bacterium]
MKNRLGMSMVLIRPGVFLMGSPTSSDPDDKPVHSVRIRNSFYMGTHEVTQQQYAKVMGVNPSKNEGTKLPVENITWDEATDFCRRLSKEDHATYRL